MFKKYIGDYFVNEKGEILNVKTNKIYTGTKSSRGYLRVDVSIDGKRKVIFPHRAVAETFIPNVLKKEQVNHINGIKTDNRLENLEWVTPKENICHAVRIGLINSKTQGGKTCVQRDLDGNIIKIFDSISEAARQVKGNDSCIFRACKKQLHTAYGFIWDFYN